MTLIQERGESVKGISSLCLAISLLYTKQQLKSILMYMQDIDTLS